MFSKIDLRNNNIVKFIQELCILRDIEDKFWKMLKPNRKELYIFLKDKLTNNYNIIDLMDFNLPHYNEPFGPRSGKEYKYEATRNWSNEIKKYDGFIFVTPSESITYNSSQSTSTCPALKKTCKAEPSELV